MKKRKRGRPKGSKNKIKISTKQIDEIKLYDNSQLEQQERKVTGQLIQLKGMPSCSLCGELVYAYSPYTHGSDFRKLDGSMHGTNKCLSETDWIEKCKDFMVRWRGGESSVISNSKPKIQKRKVIVEHKRIEVIIRKLDKKVWEAEYNNIKINAPSKGELIKRLRGKKK